MMAHYQILAQRIQMEIEELERTYLAVLRHWKAAYSAGSDQDAYLNSVALNLHSLYSGWERIFELIAIEIDGGALGGEAWHAELVKQMTLDLPGTRPPVIRKDTAAQLDEYRKFRHRIRNIYATGLDPVRMQPLVEALSTAWFDLRDQLTAFCQLLNDLAASE